MQLEQTCGWQCCSCKTALTAVLLCLPASLHCILRGPQASHSLESKTPPCGTLCHNRPSGSLTASGRVQKATTQLQALLALDLSGMHVPSHLFLKDVTTVPAWSSISSHEVRTSLRISPCWCLDPGNTHPRTLRSSISTALPLGLLLDLKQQCLLQKRRSVGLASSS